jgi:hypothetical protein
MTRPHGGEPRHCDRLGGWAWPSIFVIALGCGPTAQGPARYSIKGSVAFRNQPVPLGRIVFTPLGQAAGDVAQQLHVPIRQASGIPSAACGPMAGRLTGRVF